MGRREYMQAVLADRPRLYFPGWSEAAHRDMSNTQANGTTVPTITFPARGPFGGTVIDSNASGIVTFPDANSLDLADIWSVECWYRSDTAGTYQTLVSKAANAYAIRRSDTGKAEMLRSNVSVVATSTATMSINTWYHIVCTKSGAARKIYLNAKEGTTLGGDSACTNTTAVLNIGSDFGFFPFNGLLGQVAVYSYPLSPAQTLRHFKAGRIGRR